MARQSMESSGGRSSANASFVSMTSCSSGGSTGSSYEIETEVGRDALKEICLGALSRLLDFPDHQLETLLGQDEERGPGEEGGTNMAKNIAASLRLMKRSLGTGLVTLSQRHQRRGLYELHRGEEGEDEGPFLQFSEDISPDSQIVLLQLIHHLQNFTAHEGLFRKPGSRQRVDALVRDLGEKPFADIVLCGAYRPHDYASVLKQFFADLPQPLLLCRHLDAYFQASALSSPSSRVRCLQLLTLLLPPSHRLVLQHLLQLLAQTAAAPESKMDAANLALVFAPTLFLASHSIRDSVFPSESLEKLTSLLRFMISNLAEVFEVPKEVAVVAERHCKRRKATQEEDVPVEMYSTCCQRAADPDDFHASGQARALAEVASLFEMVQKMPDGPQKTHFMKRFESKTPGPSPYFKKSRSYFTRMKENTPKLARLKLGHGIGSQSAPRAGSQSRFSKKGMIKAEDLGRKQLHFCETPRHQSGRALQVFPTNSPMVTDV